MKAAVALVLVKWEDPSSSSTRVYALDDWQTYHQPAIVETIGWLGRDDDRGVSVFNEAYTEEGQENFRGHTMILRPLILSITTIKRAPAVRKERKRAKSRKGQAVPSADVPGVDDPDRQEGGGL